MGKKISAPNIELVPFDFVSVQAKCEKCADGIYIYSKRLGSYREPIERPDDYEGVWNVVGESFLGHVCNSCGDEAWFRSEYPTSCYAKRGEKIDTSQWS